MESHASRSARVKLQLRDKKGRWIEMGSHIKWLNLAGQPIHGIAVDTKGQDVIAEVDSIENPGEKVNVQINRKKVEVIDEKADLDGAPETSPTGDKVIPGEAEAPAAPKYNSTPGPTQIVVKTTDGTSISSLIGTLKVGDKVYPVGSGMKPYSNPTSASSAAFKKHTSGGIGTITAIKEGKYATITDEQGNTTFSSLKHYAVKQTPELDAAIFAAHKNELDALQDGGVNSPTASKWITALDPNAPKDEEQKAALPTEEAPETPAAPEAPAPAAVEPDVNVVSNHKASPGTVRVIAADDKSPIVVSVASLKVGDKVYPISSLHNKPYGDHGNYNKKSAFVHTNNPAGTGEVVAKGSNYATVKGSDGKLYYPTNNFVALKSTPGLDAKIDEVKATFDAPEESPEAPAAPEAPAVQAPEAEAPAAPVAEAPAAPAEQSPVKKPIDISKWKKTGAQMGSNDGGVYTDEDGKQWYVKKPASNEHAMNEVLADDLYKAAGIETSELQLADLGNGKLGTASPMLDGVQKNLSTKLASDKNYKKELQDGFAMDVLLANWDVVGLEFDNVVTNKEGKPVRVDPGGALLFRAMGSPKGDAFDKMASEWDTLRDSSTNSKSAKAFKDMTDEQLVESAKRVEYLTPGLIDAHVDASGFDDATKAKLKDTLKARRENIIQRAKAITPVEEQADEPIGDAPEAPAAPEPTPEVAPEPSAPAPEPEAPEAPVAPAPEPQPEAPAAPAPQEEPAPAPTETPAPEDDPFAGLVLKDKGKTVPDANGDLLKVGTKVTHSNGKNGKGIVTIVYPSTNSAKVYYENGVEQVANGKLLTPTAADVTAEPLVPASLSVGEVFFDTATGKTHIGAKDGTPLTAGSKVSYTKKGVTQTGTVKGIYKGQQTVNVDFEDGTNSTKKASALVSAEESHVDAPEIPEQDAPDVTPTPESVPDEAPAPEQAPEVPEAPEPDSAPEAPAEPESLDGKVDPTADDLDALPVGAKITSDASQSTYVKNEDGKWQPVTGDHGPYHTNMMVDGDKVAHGYKVDLTPDSAPDTTHEDAPAEAPAEEPIGYSAIGKVFNDLTEDQISALPVGTMLKNTQHGHHWKKEAGDSWKAYDTDGKTAIGGNNPIYISTGTLMDPKHNKLNTVVEVPGNDEAPVDTPAVDAPEAESPEVQAPEVPATDLKSFEGKKFADLTPEQMDEVPIGTKLVSTDYGHYWKKESADQWMAFDKEDDKSLTVPITNDKLKTEPWKSTHTLEFPKDETTESGTPEAAPVETPAPDETPEAVDVNSLEGEKLAMLDPNELKALPIGTMLKDPSSGSVYIKKTADNEWTQYANGFDGNVIATYNDESILPATKSPSGKHDATVVLPKPGEDTTPAAPEVETLDFPENVTTLPVGTVVPARTGSTVGFTKSDDNKWEMTVQGKGVGQYVDDQFVQGVVDTTKPEIIKPSADEPAASAPEPEAPEAATDATPSELTGTWGDSDLQAGDLPVGTIIGTDADSTDMVLKKTKEDEWLVVHGAGSVNKKTYPDSTINGLKSYDGWKVNKDEHKAIHNPPVDIPDPWAAIDEAISTVPQSGKWSDGPSAADAPVGTKIIKAHSNYTITKTGDNTWESSSGTAFDDGDLDYFKSNKSYDYEAAAPLGEKTELNDAIIAGFGDLPVGTKIYTGSAGWWAEKDGPDSWTSAYGTDYSDQELIDSHNDGSTHFIAAPADYALPTDSVGESSSEASKFAGHVGNKYTATSPFTGKDFPVGTVLEYPGSATGILTKTGDDSWVSTNGSPYKDDTITKLKGNEYWTIKSVPGADASAASPSTGVTFTKSLLNGYPDGTKIVSEDGYTLKKGIKSGVGGAWIPLDNGQEVKFKDGDTWASAQQLLPDGSYFPNASWTVYPPGTDIPGAPAAATPATDIPHVSKVGMTANDIKALDDGEIMVVSSGPNKGYVFKVQNSDYGDGTKLIPQNTSTGQSMSFVDGESYAAPYEVATNGIEGFKGGNFDIYPAGTDIKSLAPAPVPTGAPSVSSVHYDGMKEDNIHSLSEGSIMVATSGPQKGYIMQVSKLNGGTKLYPLDEAGNKKAFVDGVSYAAPYEVGVAGVSGFNGDYDVYPAGTTVAQIKGNAPTPVPAASSVAGVLHSEMGAGEINELPDGSLMVSVKGQHAGYVFKVQNPSGTNAKLIPLNKQTGEKMSFTDGDSFAAPYEVENGGPVEQWADNDGDFTIYPPGTTVADINGTAPAAPAGPQVPTGVVGSAGNPAVVAGKSLNAAILDSYPVGTTIKKESNSSYPSEYFSIKKADGTWDIKKKGKDYLSGKTADYIMSSYFSNSATTGTVNQPKPYSKSAVLGTGEIVYAGDTVNYKGDVGYIKSITNAGAIVVQVNGKSGPKAASTLSKSPTHGLKTHIAATINGNNSNSSTTTPAAYSPSTSNTPGTVTTANFAGASADDYNAAGVTVKANLNTPKSGVGVVSSGPVDKSNPLYGAPKPAKPEEPATLKWDSAEWLKKVEDRYAANPNKQKATVQQSNNWNTIQSVLDGHSGSLDKLLTNQYITQEMYDEAKNGITQHEANVKPLQDAHQAALQDWNSKVEEWAAANPSSSQFVDAKLPEISKDPFTGGTADWSKAAVGTYSADSAIAAVKTDAATANHGLSVATDSDQIEDLNVKFNRILDTTGEEVLEVKFKVTPLFGKDLLNTLKNNGADTGGQIYLPKMVKDENTGLMKDTATSYSNSMAYTSGTRAVLTDTDTGAKIIFNHASNANDNTPHTMSNSVRILMPKGSTSAEYQKVLENMGIKAKPATAGDIKILGENKFISVMGGNHEYKKNFHGEDRQKNIDKLKAKYGVSPDDLHFGVDSNGDSKFFFSDEAVAKLQAYTKVSGFKHNLMGSGTASEQFFAMITGAHPGLLSTYQRWTHGIHASGMSSSADMASGAGDFLYTKTLHDTSGLAEGGNSVGINAKAALKRIDVYGNQSDQGNGHHQLSSPPAFDLMKGSPYEIQFKHGVPLSEWSHINIASESERQKLIKRLIEHGITKINGIPLENFILTSGMKIPEIDPSVYNVVSG